MHVSRRHRDPEKNIVIQKNQRLRFKFVNRCQICVDMCEPEMQLFLLASECVLLMCVNVVYELKA